jgi:DNA mismatch repair protein MutS
MRQYLDMKEAHPGAVLLLRLGDFYEVFFGDAVVVSRALDLVLTARGLDERGVEIPMCGIPWHAAESYVGRLVKQGISVAIAEQLETPEEARRRGHKQIERSVARVLTAGTLTDENLLSPKKSNFLAAVSGRQIAAADISTGEFLYGEADDVFGELVRLDPAEVLFDEALAEAPDIMRIRGAFNCAPIHSRQWDSHTGGSKAEKMLLAYLDVTQKSAVKLGPPKQFGAERRLLVDASSWKSLEIDEPLSDGGAALLDIIDRTKTAPGGRLLRAMLRNLPSDAAEIEARQNHVAHLRADAALMRELSGALVRAPDVSRSLSRISAGRAMARDLSAVLGFLKVLPDIRAMGPRFDSGLAIKIQKMELFADLCGDLTEALSDSMPALLRDGGVIKRGYSKELDEALDLAGGGKELIAQLQSEYCSQTGVPLKIKYNGIIGYFIEAADKNAAPLMDPASGFILRQNLVGSMRFITPRLAELDGEIKSASMRAAVIEQEIITRVVARISEAAPQIGETAAVVAEIDVYAALAEVADDLRWTRPRMIVDPVLRVEGGRHAVVEHNLRQKADSFVKNGCLLGGEKSVALITGPNMAGKSTYLRQNALIIILAHLGSFVPADRAEVGLCDQLFSRVGASDNLASGQSTFMVEMSETANIVARATSQSFIIFDEIGRGTATFDGMAIAQAVLEHVSALGCRCLFATHYHELTGVELPSVKNLTIEVKEAGGDIVFMHKIIGGAASRSYGIHVARLAGMPASVVGRAQNILDSLERGASATAAEIGQTAEDIHGEKQLSLF